MQNWIESDQGRCKSRVPTKAAIYIWVPISINIYCILSGIQFIHIVLYPFKYMQLSSVDCFLSLHPFHCPISPLIHVFHIYTSFWSAFCLLSFFLRISCHSFFFFFLEIFPLPSSGYVYTISVMWLQYYLKVTFI